MKTSDLDMVTSFSDVFALLEGTIPIVMDWEELVALAAMKPALAAEKTAGCADLTQAIVPLLRELHDWRRGARVLKRIRCRGNRTVVMAVDIGRGAMISQKARLPLGRVQKARKA